MKTKQLIEICKERNELDFLFQITKQIAQSDSIGEGYLYRQDYDLEYFNNAEPYELNGALCKYLEYGGLPIYEIYLKHLGVIK
jgi:hypothetical protein